MTGTAAGIAPGVGTGWMDWLRRELAPLPGRGATTVRIVVTVVLVVIISMALQIPEALLSAFMVLFTSKENRVVTALVGALTILGVTIGMAESLLLYRWTFDYPELRVPAIAVSLFVGFYLSRVFVIGPLAFGAGFVFALTQTVADSIPTGEQLVRSLLWLWVALVYPMALTVAVTHYLLPAQSHPAPPPGPPKPRKPLLAADAFTNPAHVHFALKVTLAAMTCYILYTAIDWPGIHTAFITCCIISLESTGATLHKGALRFAGCAIGGLLGFLSIIYLVPRMEGITSLALLMAAVTTLAGWVAAGSARIAYAGLQIGLAFNMCLIQDFAPDTDFDKIRDRVVGILLGIGVTTLAYRYLWPERETNPGPIP